MTHTLKEFNIDKITTGYPTILIIGKRGSGKSTLINDLIFRFGKKTPLMMAISKSEMTNETYSKILPNSLVYDMPDPALFKKINDRQEEYTRKINKKVPGFDQTKESQLIVMDDCIETSRDDWTKDSTLGNFFTQGRHKKLILIVAIHAVKSIPPTLRNNADYVFIFKTSTAAEKDKLKSEYIDVFSNKRDFNDVFSRYTDDYKCIVVDNMTKDSNDITSKFSWYRANASLKPTGCEKLLWDLDKLIYQMIYKRMKARYEKKKAELERNTKANAKRTSDSSSDDK